MVAFLLVVFVVCLSSIASGNELKRVDQCGRYTRLKNPYSIGQAYSHIECTVQCLGDSSCVAVTSCAQDSTRWRTCEKSNNLTSLYNCDDHEINAKCSTWKKVNPCTNGAPFINNSCVCTYPYHGVACQHVIYPVSCSDIRRRYRAKNQTAAPNIYYLYTSSKKSVKVFCDFKNESFGVMYIPKSSLSKFEAADMKELVPDNRVFMLREKLTNLDEKESLVTMLPRSSYANLKWSITAPVNLTLFNEPEFDSSPYIFIGGIPKTEMEHHTYFGFDVGQIVIEKICNDSTLPNSFIFYSRELYQTSSYEIACQDVQVKLKTTCTHKLPSDDFFYFPFFQFKCLMRCFKSTFKDLIGFTPGFLFE